MDLEIFLKYFNFVGALVAFFLGIMKFYEFYRDKPHLSITETNSYYDYYKNETRFHTIFTIINKGPQPITILAIKVDLLDNKNKQLNIHSTAFEVKKRLIPHDCLEKDITYKIFRTLPRENYRIRANITSSYKTYERIIDTPHFEDFSGPIYDEISGGLKKGLIED